MARCFWCDGTGKYKKPHNASKYEEIFDKFDAAGTFTMGQCREMALERVGYEIINCEYCNGTGKGK